MSGSLFIVSAPSGAGKTTLVRGLLERDKGIDLSVSYTTRAPRAGEVDGVAYHFIDVPGFMHKRDHGDFVEWAEVHGNYYATSASWLSGELERGRDVLLEIDWQGAAQVRKVFPAAVGIFILPPSFEELARRLRGRGTDSEAIIQRRLAAAVDEMRRVVDFDYAIINNDLQIALSELQQIVAAARLRVACVRERHPQAFEFLTED